MSSSHCCFLTCIQVSEEAGKVVLVFLISLRIFQFVVIYKVKGLSIVSETEVGVFLEKHMETHDRNFSCEYCGDFVRSEIRTHQKSHVGKSHFLCKQCGKYFKCSLCLQCHKNIHSGLKPYKCEKCGKVTFVDWVVCFSFLIVSSITCLYIRIAFLENFLLPIGGLPFYLLCSSFALKSLLSSIRSLSIS